MLLFYDGFDHYPSAQNFGIKNNWSSNIEGQVANVTPFGKGYSILLNNGQSIGRSIPPQKSYIFGFAHSPISANSNGDYSWMSISDAAQNRQLTFRINPATLAPEIWRGTISTGVLIGSGSPVQNNAFSYIEILCTIDPVFGLVQVNVNGEQSINLVNVNTQGYGGNQTVGYVGFQSFGGSAYYDDFYVCDLTGPAPFNAMLGPIRVQTIYPGAGGPSTEFAPLQAPNWNEVADVLMAGDASYNEGTIPGLQDMFRLGGNSLTDPSSQIFALALTGCYRFDDAGPHSVSNTIQSGAIMQQGATIALTAGYQYQQDILLTDPSTNDNWTAAAVNAIQLGYKMVS